MKNTHEIHFEKKEIIVLFFAIGLLTNGITIIIGIFLIFWLGNRLLTRFFKQENIEFPNTEFVN